MLFWQMMRDGGPVMWLLLFCSVVAMVVFLEKWFQFHREQINVGELMRGLFNVLKRDGYVEAISLCDNTPGPVPKLLNSAILAYQRGERSLDRAIDSACRDEIPRLEGHLNILGTIGYIAPLLGLFGTVLGMMSTFQVVFKADGDGSMLAPSIGMALICTAAGIAVAIPCYLAYNYLAARLSAILLDMEKAASEITAFFEQRGSGIDRDDA